MPTYRNELVRILADLDQTLAKAEEIAASPYDECRQSAIDFLIEFEPVRRKVEGELKGNDG
jgi:hypothetical protein